MNGLHPIENFYFIEYLDNEGNLKISFALYYFKGVYYNLYNKEFFKPKKVTFIKNLTEYVKLENKFISLDVANYFKIKFAEDFIMQTQYYKNIQENSI